MPLTATLLQNCYTYLELLLELLFLNVKRDRLILKRPTDRQRASDGQGTATIPGGLGSHSEYWSPIIVRIELYSMEEAFSVKGGDENY